MDTRLRRDPLVSKKVTSVLVVGMDLAWYYE